MNAPMVYKLRKPKQSDPGKLYPALFLVHGRGSNERNMFDFVEGLEEEFYIFSVRGHIPQPPGYSFFTFRVYGHPDREGFDEGVSLITSFIEYASNSYPIDTGHLYLLGFSQGAVMSNTLALTLGDTIKGIVSLSGYIPAFVKDEYDRKPIEGLSIFLSHGVEDSVLSYEWGKSAKDYFENSGAAVSFCSYPCGHTVSPQNQRDLKEWLLNDLKNKRF